MALSSHKKKQALKISFLNFNLQGLKLLQRVGHKECHKGFFDLVFYTSVRLAWNFEPLNQCKKYVYIP